MVVESRVLPSSRTTSSLFQAPFQDSGPTSMSDAYHSIMEFTVIQWFIDSEHESGLIKVMSGGRYREVARKFHLVIPTMKTRMVIFDEIQNVKNGKNVSLSYINFQVQSKLGSLVAGIVQVIALITYVAAYFPGGTQTIRLGGSLALRGASSLLPR